MSTKTARIVENLGQRLRDGEWENAASLPSVALLSGQYNVSPGTIALALKSLEQEGLVKVVPRLGVFSTVENGSLTGEKSVCPTIGIYGGYSMAKNGGYMAYLTGSILDAAHNLGGSVLMLPKVAPGEQLTRQDFERQGVKGIIFLGGQYSEVARHLKEEGYPVITANMPIGATAMNYVSFDLAGNVRFMTEYFASMGHRRIAVLTYESSTPGLYESFKTDFIHTLCQEDIHYNPNPYWRTVNWPLDQAEEEKLFLTIEKLLALPTPPTAFFCRSALSDVLSKYLKQKKLRVPQDISIIGAAYNNDASASTSGFILQFETLGKRLVEGIHEIIKNPFHSIQELVPLPFVDKGTVAPLAKRKK